LHKSRRKDSQYIGEYDKPNGGSTKWYRANDSQLRDSLEIEVAPDSEVVVRSYLSYRSCRRDRYTDRNWDKPFIHALKDGDKVPAYSGYDGQVDVGEYLDPYINPTDNTISLAPNQIIYLFEMWSDSNPNSSTYDLQDNIVLVTFSSSQQ
jgi:hypothetical protein